MQKQVKPYAVIEPGHPDFSNIVKFWGLVPQSRYFRDIDQPDFIQSLESVERSVVFVFSDDKDKFEEYVHKVKKKFGPKAHAVVACTGDRSIFSQLRKMGYHSVVGQNTIGVGYVKRTVKQFS